MLLTGQIYLQGVTIKVAFSIKLIVYFYFADNNM